MEITAINEHSIKFSLSGEELRERGLSAEALDSADTGAKRLIWELMDRARIENGFDCRDARLLVRVFPSRDGGCELFVTLHEPAAVREKPKTSGCIAVTAERDEILFALCRRMKNAGFRGKSKLYADGENRLILLLESARRLPSYIQGKGGAERLRYSFLYEYGCVWEISDEHKAYLNEHTKLLCAKGAVERLACVAV